MTEKVIKMKKRSRYIISNLYIHVKRGTYIGSKKKNDFGLSLQGYKFWQLLGPKNIRASTKKSYTKIAHPQVKLSSNQKL